MTPGVVWCWENDPLFGKQCAYDTQRCELRKPMFVVLLPVTIIGCFGQGINKGVSIQRFQFSLPSEVMYYPRKLLKLPHKSARHSVLCNLWSSIATLFSTHVLLWRWNNDIAALSTRQFYFGSNGHPKAQRFDLYWAFQRYKHSLRLCPGFGMALLGCCHGVNVSVCVEYWNVDHNLCIACVSPIRKLLSSFPASSPTVVEPEPTTPSGGSGTAIAGVVAALVVALIVIIIVVVVAYFLYK